MSLKEPLDPEVDVVVDTPATEPLGSEAYPVPATASDELSILLCVRVRKFVCDVFLDVRSELPEALHLVQL